MIANDDRILKELEAIRLNETEQLRNLKTELEKIKQTIGIRFSSIDEVTESYKDTYQGHNEFLIDHQVRGRF